MPEAQNEQSINVDAVIAQINTLKQQRNNAMDDVAVLLGQLESKTNEHSELLGKYKKLIEDAVKDNEAKTDNKTMAGSTEAI